ncbi:hypothetical protein BO98_01240 [Candidatus Synechococcus spongiarum LMB bulk10D]|nr:hypothetical protein BO98_01240 [Candidatus Synechococcus spongiarum LMB bulk10D]
MFQFAGLARTSLWIQLAVGLPQGCPIRKFPDQSLLPAPRDLSQVVTSFIASTCQGIHREPFVA